MELKTGELKTGAENRDRYVFTFTLRGNIRLEPKDGKKKEVPFQAHVAI